MRILDMGCGAGHTAQMLIRTLKALGINFEYLGVSPHSEQVAAFNTAMASARIRNARAVGGSLETFQVDELYDIVVANHCLYYAEDLTTACAKLLSLGREVVIAHHGELGIDEVHRALPRVVNATANAVSTYLDVLKHLPNGRDGDRRARGRHLHGAGGHPQLPERVGPNRRAAHVLPGQPTDGQPFTGRVPADPSVAAGALPRPVPHAQRRRHPRQVTFLFRALPGDSFLFYLLTSGCSIATLLPY